MKVNPRKITKATTRQVRLYIRELRTQDNSTIADLRMKVAAVLLYAWATEGLSLLRTRRNQLEKWLGGTDEWEDEYVKSLFYSNDTAVLDRRTRQQAERSSATAKDKLNRIQAHLMLGRLEQAKASCQSLLSGAQSLELSQLEAETAALVLMSLGQKDWLLAHGPVSLNNAGFADQARTVWAEPDAEPPVCLCINLDRDTQRMARARGFLEPGASPLRRIAGVPGAALPDTLLENSPLRPAIRVAGELGAALSHLKVWEWVSVNATQGEYVLVVEDDSVFTFGPGYGFDAAKAHAAAEGYGMMTVSGHAAREARRLAGDAPTSIPVDDILPATIGRAAGLGAYGYLLNRDGAQTLVAVTSAIGLAAVADWQLKLAFVQDPSGLQDHPRYREGVTRLQAAQAEGRLPDQRPRAGCYTIPLIRTSDFGQKSINEEGV
jgi:GR25 family glycosyltransferase involved in LPS biosynthesis